MTKYEKNNECLMAAAAPRQRLRARSRHVSTSPRRTFRMASASARSFKRPCSFIS